MEIRTRLITCYRWLRHYGLNDSHSGNASARDGDRIWVTPTGACADTLTEDDLVECSIEDEPGANASLDAPLHLAVYRQNPEAAAVLHSHGPYSVALTMGGDDYVPPDFEGAYYFGTVPVLNVAYDRYTRDAPLLMARTLARHPVAVIRGHGVYAWGKDLDQAYKWSCTLESSAKTAFLARQAGTLDHDPAHRR